MKRAFILLFLLFYTLTNAFTQENHMFEKYIDGYEDFKWGTSLEVIKNKYSNLIKENVANCQSGEECYSSVSDSIERVFRFYNNKLYWVRVIYDDISQTQLDALCNKLTSKYGFFYLNIDGDDDVKFGYEWVLLTDLTVTLHVVNKINSFGAKIGEGVFITYYSPYIYEEMKISEIENIEL